MLQLRPFCQWGLVDVGRVGIQSKLINGHLVFSLKIRLIYNFESWESEWEQ